MLVASIKAYVKPVRLYRYRSLDQFDREVDAIAQGYLYCAAYTNLNDPMEGLFSSSQLLRRSEDYRTIRTAVRENKAQIGMCSFSEVHDHELMWAHYAKRFSGVCIAYSLSRLLEHLPKDVSFVRMYYNEEVPTIRVTRTEPSQLAKMVLSYKNYRWLYEREWRMFGPLGKAIYTTVNCVTRVYLGSRIGDTERERLMRKLTSLNIEHYEMSIDEYSISFEKCS
jgi:hypothetical protein